METNETTLKFFRFRQNNSGGSFHVSDKVGEYVIIQAKDVEEAKSIALDVGIYFNGCSSGRDCSCCGDRWYPPWDDEAEEDIDSVLDSIKPTFTPAIAHVYYHHGAHMMIKYELIGNKDAYVPYEKRKYNLTKSLKKNWRR